jgi:hypothetical protein
MIGNISIYNSNLEENPQNAFFFKRTETRMKNKKNTRLALPSFSFHFKKRKEQTHKKNHFLFLLLIFLEKVLRVKK